MKKIAIDAMGGDNAPQALVEGVNQAVQEFSDIEILLYGDEAKIKPYLTAGERVRIIHTEVKIDSDDEPTKAIRQKKEASMVLAAKAMKAGEADAMLSAGNTGALWQQASLSWGVSRILTDRGSYLLCQRLAVRDLICWIWEPMLKTQPIIYTSMRLWVLSMLKMSEESRSRGWVS